jgi:hypothetical protein
VSDERLRELERRFRASGSVEDEAAWLRARVQAGELEQSKLELAAYCDQPAAVLVLGEVPPQPPPGQHYSELERWASKLEDCSRRIAVRAAIAGARLVLEQNPLPAPLVRASSRAIRAAEAWCLSPNPRTASAADKAWLEAQCYSWREIVDDAERWRARLSVSAAGESAAAASAPTKGYSGMAARSLDTAARAIAKEFLRYAFGTFDVLAEDEGNEAIRKDLPERTVSLVREAVRSEVVPFVLGYSDPVRERVEARERKAVGE